MAAMGQRLLQQCGLLEGMVKHLFQSPSRIHFLT
jgi:hypothetical protein